MNRTDTEAEQNEDTPIMMKIGKSSNISLDNISDSPPISPVRSQHQRQNSSMAHSFNSSPTPATDKKLTLRRNASYGNMMPTNSTEAKVLVIYTGGTIGMIRNRNNGEYLIFFLNILSYIC